MVKLGTTFNGCLHSFCVGLFIRKGVQKATYSKHSIPIHFFQFKFNSWAPWQGVAQSLASINKFLSKYYIMLGIIIIIIEY